MAHPSIDHLRAHHRDFEAFRDAMVETAPGRFGPLWWGAWRQLVKPADEATIVDLGAGPGGLLGGLRAEHPDARLIALEMQPAMLEVLHPLARDLDVEVIEADLHEPVPLPDGSVDVVVAVMVLHELMHPPRLVEDAARLLKPGGVVVIYDWVRWSLEDYLGEDELDEDRMQHFREHCMFTADDLAFLCRREGLRIREIVGRRGGRFAIVVAEKPADEAE